MDADHRIGDFGQMAINECSSQTLIGVQRNHEKVDIPESLDDGAAPITGIEEVDPEPVSDIKARSSDASQDPTHPTR